MICLSDNDIILKLAVCDLLADALAALEATREEVYVLPTARFVLLRPKHPEQAKERFGEAVVERVRAFLESVRVIDRSPPPEEQQILDDLVGIDAGEAVLFSATAYFPEYLLATSDKRSLRVLSAEAACQPICRRLAGKVFCFEQVILRIIDRMGFDAVRAKVIPARHCDTALRSRFRFRS